MNEVTNGKSTNGSATLTPNKQIDLFGDRLRNREAAEIEWRGQVLHLLSNIQNALEQLREQPAAKNTTLTTKPTGRSVSHLHTPEVKARAVARRAEKLAAKKKVEQAEVEVIARKVLKALRTA